LQEAEKDQCLNKVVINQNQPKTGILQKAGGNQFSSRSQVPEKNPKHYIRQANAMIRQGGCIDV